MGESLERSDIFVYPSFLLFEHFELVWGSFMFRVVDESVLEVVLEASLEGFPSGHARRERSVGLNSVEPLVRALSPAFHFGSLEQ